MSESDEGSKRIKVVDRRRFDESGDLRPDRPPPPEKKAASPPLQEPAAPAPKATPAAAEAPGHDRARPFAAESGETETTSPLFLDLVAGLAQQAEILLTGGQGLPAQPAEAQRVIEILSMLESKMTGNLSTEEKRVLSSVVFQLRALYVQHNT